jgi:hypothetical protein
MKIRHGFVSNSSSSSFCIYGSQVEVEDLMKAAKALDIEFDEEDFDDYDIGEQIESKTDLEYHSMMGEYYYIGRSYSNIKDDETGKQFKESVVNAFEKLGLGALKLGEIEQAWRDG